MSKAIGKTVRYSLIVLGIVVAVLLAAPFFIDVNDYKAEIEQGVENATGRKLSVGAISASLFPWVGVQLDDVHLANRAGFSERDFLAVQRLHVKLALLPLLSKEVEIKHFEVVSPKVYLERHANGETNWGDLVSQGGNAAPAEGAPAAGSGGGGGAAPLLAALKAESISLNGGELIWADGEKKPLVLSDLELLLNDVQLDRPISTHMSGKLDGNAFNVDAKVGPLGDLSKLEPAKLAVQGQVKVENVRLGPFQDVIAGWPAMMGDVNNATAAATANIEARPDGVRTGEGTVVVEGAHKLELNWKIEMPKPEQLELRRAELAVDGKSIVDVKGNVKQLTSAPVFQLRLEGQPLERTWLAGFLPELNSMYAAHPAPWKQIKFGTLIAGDDKHVDIRDLQLMLDGELVQVSGAVVYKQPDIRLRITTKDLHVDPWLPQAKEQAAAGMDLSIVREAVAAEEQAAEPDLRFLKPWLVTAKFQTNTMFLRGLEMKNFQANINGSDGRFDLSPLSFGLSGGNVTEKASINVAAYPVRWTESVHVTGVQVGPLLKTLADMDMLEGTMEMDTNLKATGVSDAAVASLNGRGNVMLRNGKVKGFDIAGALRKFTNPGAPSGPQETDFAQLSGSFVITNGVADNQDLFMASPLLRVTGHGKVDLVQKLLDYHVKPRVVGTLKGQGDTGLRQGLSVPMHISGPFDSPRIRPEIDAKAILENAPALLNKGKVGGALGKILGKPANGQDAPPPADSAPQQPEKPVDKLRKGLGGLIPGL